SLSVHQLAWAGPSTWRPRMIVGRSNRMLPGLLAALLLVLAMPASAAAQAGGSTWTSGSGALLLEPRHDMFASLGIQLGKGRHEDALTLPLLAATPLTIVLG